MKALLCDNHTGAVLWSGDSEFLHAALMGWKREPNVALDAILDLGPTLAVHIKFRTETGERPAAVDLLMDRFKKFQRIECLDPARGARQKGDEA